MIAAISMSGDSAALCIAALAWSNRVVFGTTRVVQ
jgi:hypothetical protein